jgi:CheY-like chemotaxis protein
MFGTQFGKPLMLGGGGVEATTESNAAFDSVRSLEPRGKTILVADDDPAVRELVSTLLQYRGYRVLRAADGAAGLEYLRHRPVDMLITDLDMPILDGRELAGRARATRPDLPVLFMSGSAADADFDLDRAVGPSGFLSKPFSFSALMSEIENLLQRRDADSRRALQVV